MGNYLFKYPSASLDVTINYPTSSGTFALTSQIGSSFSLNNAGANRIIVSDGTATAATASANLTFDSSTLRVTGSLNLTGSAEVLNVKKITEITGADITVGVGVNTLTIPLTSGSIFTVTVNDDIDTITINGTPAQSSGFTLILKNNINAAYTIAWNSAGIKWPGGTPPTPSPVLNDIDIYSVFTPNGGTTWYGFEGGLDFS